MDMNVLFMIWRSWLRTLVRSNLGCIVLLSKSYLNQKYKLGNTTWVTKFLGRFERYCIKWTCIALQIDDSTFHSFSASTSVYLLVYSSMCFSSMQTSQSQPLYCSTEATFGSPSHITCTSITLSSWPEQHLQSWNEDVKQIEECATWTLNACTHAEEGVR